MDVGREGYLPYLRERGNHRRSDGAFPLLANLLYHGGCFPGAVLPFQLDAGALPEAASGFDERLPETGFETAEEEHFYPAAGVRLPAVEAAGMTRLSLKTSTSPARR
jgi:hypothetical protein